MSESKVALIDLDDTVANYSSALKEGLELLRGPSEPPFVDRRSFGEEPPHLEARRKLLQRVPGFWKGLHTLPLGLEIVEELRALKFDLHVLTKGPRKTPNAWSEKQEWCTEHLPDAKVTVSEEKSLVYGRVLVDDFPDYFTSWLGVRPRGLVVCVAHPWNEKFANGHDPNVFRYDGTNREELRKRLVRAYEREGGQHG